MAILTIIGLLGLFVAVLTGSTPLAVIVVALAVAGIVLLIRDWRADRPRGGGVPAPGTENNSRIESHHLVPDDFSPDISTDPNGPSSDARADQI